MIKKRGILFAVILSMLISYLNPMVLSATELPEPWEVEASAPVVEGDELSEEEQQEPSVDGTLADEEGTMEYICEYEALDFVEVEEEVIVIPDDQVITVSFDNEEFEELNRSLNHAARQLARYDSEQKAFFQNVSHELRTPLMSIKSYAEGIKYEIMDPAHASMTILEATDKLAGMVDDILYVSRLDNITTPTMQEIDIIGLIDERIRAQKNLALSKGLKLDFKSDEEPIIIYCVVKYIERAVDNLISNAIRYAASAITVECYATGAHATVRVLDDGPGFAPDELPQVFERFFKGKSGLTGIGLSIVKSVVEQHKGTATAENGINGAVLTISIPRRK